jgi:serine/threonine protein phosphatase PrpC
MRVRTGARSDIGRLRQRNEDGYLIKEPLFVVADGMGGHRGGDVASALALETIGSAATPGGTAKGLVDDIKRANRAVLERGESDRDLRGMGTTLTAVLTEDARAHVVHVGDSRAYLLRDGALQQLTEDHTLVQRMVREGRLTEDEAAQHPQRSILTRALGVDEDIPVDELSLDIHPGDRLLLCTDGLTNMVERDRIQEILETEEDPQSACEKLIDAANRAGGDDNITVVVLAFDEGGDPTVAVDSESETASTTKDSSGGSAGSGTSSAAAAATADLTTATPATAEPEDGQRATTSASTVAAEPEKPARRGLRIRWPKVALWVGVVVFVLAGALIGARVYIDRQWYVGDASGKVAIYNGIPIEVAGLELSHVEQTTNLDARQAQRLQPWVGLKDGITADSFGDARTIVEQIRRDLQRGGTG